MLRIRFDKECVTVSFDDGPNSMCITEKYDKVEVDILEHNFWAKVLQPFETLRAGISCAMMIHHVNMAALSERKKENGEGGDDV